MSGPRRPRRRRTDGPGMREQPRNDLTHIDPLIDAADAEHDRFNELVAVSQGEGVVAGVRQDDLVAEQAAALRRWNAAKGLLTKAQKNGDTERIAAARRRVDAAAAEFFRISKANISELAQISTARHDSTAALFDQMRRSWDAGDAVLDALREQRPSEPPIGEGTTP